MIGCKVVGSMNLLNVNNVQPNIAKCVHYDAGSQPVSSAAAVTVKLLQVILLLAAMLWRAALRLASQARFSHR